MVDRIANWGFLKQGTFCPFKKSGSFWRFKKPNDDCNKRRPTATTMGERKSMPPPKKNQRAERR